MPGKGDGMSGPPSTLGAPVLILSALEPGGHLSRAPSSARFQMPDAPRTGRRRGAFGCCIHILSIEYSVNLPGDGRASVAVGGAPRGSRAWVIRALRSARWRRVASSFTVVDGDLQVGRTSTRPPRRAGRSDVGVSSSTAAISCSTKARWRLRR